MGMGKKRTIATKSLSILFAIVLTSLICTYSFDYLESLTYDARFRLKVFHHANPLIELVAIDSKTIQEQNGKITLQDYTQALDKIAKSRPSFVLSLISPTTFHASLNEKIAFNKTALKIPNFYISYDDGIMRGEEGKLILPRPFEKLQMLPGVIAFDQNNFAKDGVSRRAYFSIQDQEFVQPLIAGFYNGITNPTQYRGYFSFKDSDQIYINYQKPGTYSTISFVDLLKDNSSKDLENKIVIIGYDDKFTPEYYLKTPFTRDVVGMSKLEAQANVLQTFIENNGIVKAPQWLNFVVTLLFALLVLFSVMNLSPARGILVILSSLAGFLLISWTLFVSFHLAIGMAQPILAIFLCYYFFIPYRLIQENKKFWELTQRNKLLVQVEELKNNFLSLMSHDLKTPLARIQGMADVALSSPQNLNSNQKEAISTIKQSADELTEFISSILDLSRVESQEIKLKLQSKDVNRLLEEVVQKYRYMAAQKNIELITEFETLFSVKFDADLMKQVFSNLIENAIKYSAEGTKVLISTEEHDGRILVQVADQGIGISDNEIKSIFSKFYRTKNVKNSQTKGTGLGLYLAKYFVELHKGHISVESIPQQGSTFSVDLPMDL